LDIVLNVLLSEKAIEIVKIQIGRKIVGVDMEFDPIVGNSFEVHPEFEQTVN